MASRKPPVSGSRYATATAREPEEQTSPVVKAAVAASAYELAVAPLVTAAQRSIDTALSMATAARSAVTHAALVAVLVALLRKVRERAKMKALMVVRDEMSRALGRPYVIPRAVANATLPPKDVERLTKAVEAIVSQSLSKARNTQSGTHPQTDPVKPPQSVTEPQKPMSQADYATKLLNEGANRLKRLVENEAHSAAQRAAMEVMKNDPTITGWVRSIESDACELCVNWRHEKDGIPRVYKVGAEFATHTRCRCTPLPVIRRKEV